jgi:hypothetical protein
MVDAVHLRTVLTNTNLIDRVQQTQQEQQDQNLRHAIQEDLKEFANKKDAVNLTTRMENKIVVKDETQKQGSKGEEGKEQKEEEKIEKAETADEIAEGSIIDIHV